jgi:PKD repeat protein
VKLAASKTGSSNSIVKTNYITDIVPIDAKFKASTTFGPAPLAVFFIDQSTNNPTSWKWDFNNDGVTDATTQNPSWKYSAPGKYSVSLIVSKPGSLDTPIKKDYISVEKPNEITKEFDQTNNIRFILIQQKGRYISDFGILNPKKFWLK